MPARTVPVPPAPDDKRVRFYRAALACVSVAGLDATSVEDVARAAGSSRATLYRTFPGGRDQLVRETVEWEVTTFFASLALAVADRPDLEAKLTTGLVVGRRAMAEHTLLQRLLRTEPEAMLGELSATNVLVLEAIITYLAGELDAARHRGEVRADCDVVEASDHLARLFLSYLGSPGRWDFDDPAQVQELVRGQFLAGVRVPG